MCLTEPPRYWNYFQGKGILTHEKFPDDLDTTSLGLVTMKPPKGHVHSIMDEMLTYLNDDGLPYVSPLTRTHPSRYLTTDSF